MKLALVSPLPPCSSPWAAAALELIEHLGREHDVEVFLEHQFSVAPQVLRSVSVRPAGDLPHHIRTDDALPIYLVADDIHSLHQFRFLGSWPGIAVLPRRLDTLAARLAEQTDSNRIGLFPGFTAAHAANGGALASAIGEMSRGAVFTETSSPIQTDAITATLLETLAKLGDRIPSAKEERPSVQAVVVSYNSKTIIDPCLRSLVDQDYPDVQITMVDNASSDGTASYVREHFPDIEVIDSRHNLGFAGGCNLGFQASSSQYIVLLNQDAVADRSWIAELVRVAELDPGIAAVGSKLLMDRCPTILNSTGIEINEAGWAWDRQVGERDEEPSPLPQEVFGVCGGALLFNRAAIEAVGAFDTSFFMYFEDTDLSWRLRLSGSRIYYAPLAVVRHDFHGDTGATPGRALRRRYYSERNRIQTLFKNAESRSLRRVLPRILKYDRGRMKAYRRNARRGQQPEFHRELARILRRAWTWNLLRLPSLLARRRRVQKRATSASNVQPFILPGLNEGGHQGDVDCFQDRFSAAPGASIVMGTSDQKALGSGWHALEHPPGATQPYRWCKGRSWFYLDPQPGSHRLTITLASPIAENTVAIFAEDSKIGEVRVNTEVGETSFELPSGLHDIAPWEFRLECRTVRPADRDPVGDIRDLGVILFEMRLE